MFKVDALDITRPLPRKLARTFSDPAAVPSATLENVFFPYSVFEQPPHGAKKTKDSGPWTQR